MTVQKMLIGGIIAGSLAFSASPALGLAWDWPYPWADPKEAAQDRGQSHAAESDRRQPEFVASRKEPEKDRSHNSGDKNALKGDRNDLSNDSSELNRDRRDR